MKNKTMFSAMAVFLCAFAVADPTEYFVDRNRTDDSGDGKSEQAAFRTIRHAIETAKAGDTITVLPGDYGDDQGVQYTDVDNAKGTSVGSRLLIDKNITLRSRDGAATTHIIGKWADSANGMGNTAVRCLTTSSACTISGFTFRDGATDSGSESNPVRGGGIMAMTGGKNVVVTDCVISNCVGTRGGGAYDGKYIRCKFVGNFASNYGAAARAISAFNCLFTHNARSTGSTGAPGVIAYPSAIVNCTIVNNFQQGVEYVYPGPIVNTVILHNAGGSGSNVFANDTYGQTRWKCCVTDLLAIQQYGDNCVRSSNGLGVFFSSASGDYRPVPDSMLDGKGSLALAQQHFAAYVGGKDIAGHTFCADGETISIGAFQEVKSTNDVGCLVIGVDSNYGSFAVNGNPVPTTQEYRSDRYPDIAHVGFTAAAGKGIVGYSRSDTGGVDWPLEDDSVYMLTPKTGTCTATFHGATNFVYVAVSNKGDASANGSAAHPYWEIIQATTNLKSGSIIIVDDGHYSEGGYVADGVTNRLYVSNSGWKRIKSKNGASKTFIHGASDTSENAREGCGPASVRCAWLGFYTQLQGFTLLDGRSSSTSADSDVAAVRGGGVLFTTSDVNNKKLIGVTDCVISNCVASRGAAINGGIYERCLITKNHAYNNGVTRNCTLSSCLVVDNGDGGAQYGIIGFQSTLYNCTVVDNRSTIGSFSINNSARTPVVASIVSDTDGSDYDITAGLAYCTNNVIGRVQNQTAVDGRYGDPMYVDKENGDYRVRADGPAAGFGRPDNLFRATDYTGKPFFIGEDGSFTVGAFTEKLGVITPASTNAIAGGISPAEAIVCADATNVTFEATERGARHLLGFDVNGEFREDDGTGQLEVSYSPVSGGDGVWLRVNAIYDNNWYADAINGNDENNGYTTNFAKRTLAAAAALMHPGDTLNVAPGVYSNGVMLSSYTSNPILGLTWTPAVHARLVVTTGCSVVSIEGPEKTFIVGAPDDSGDSDGLGPKAVKGVFLGPNARLSGFTVTGGHTDKGSENGNTSAGGIEGYNYSSLVENCIISNNISQRAGGMRWGTCRNCRFLGNKAPSRGNTSAARNVKAYQCLFDNGRGNVVVADSWLYNCTIGAGNKKFDGAKLDSMTWALSPAMFKSEYVNTVFAVQDTNIEAVYMTNCAYAAGVNVISRGSAPPDNVNPVIAEDGDLGIDSSGRPLKGSVVIDAGDIALSRPPAIDKDIDGNQRIYNNAIDIGCYEYDARDDFARTLKPNGGVVVTNASPTVEQTEGGILIRDGELAANWTRPNVRGACVFDCVVTGGGLLKVLLNGETFASLGSGDGAKTFEFRNDRTENAFTFRYEASDGDTGGALVSKIAWNLGSILRIR